MVDTLPRHTLEYQHNFGDTASPSTPPTPPYPHTQNWRTYLTRIPARESLPTHSVFGFESSKAGASAMDFLSQLRFWPAFEVEIWLAFSH